MTLRELATLVKSMRDAQERRNNHPNGTDLLVARQYELKVDAAVERILNPQPDLFDQDSKS